jgi:Fic family protein
MTELLVQIDKLKSELDALRPLRQDSIRSLMEALDIEMVYSSNAIEGNSLTLRETQLVLEQGITVGGKPLKDHLEAVHLSSAWQRVKEIATKPDSITEAEVLELHRMVLGADDPHAGCYRTVPVFIKGAKHVPPNAARVSDLMQKLFSQPFARIHPVVASARWHYQIAAVHPFVDGNGRAARLAMNLHLMRAGFPPLRIQPVERLAYYEALDASRLDDSTVFEHWIAQREHAELEHWLGALRS